MIASLRVSLFALLTPITPFTSLKTNSEPFAAAQGKLRDGPIAMGSERSFAALRMTNPQAVILSPFASLKVNSAKDLERTCG
jgi:hypothetical protein